jgi:hypothetical protein
MELARLVLLPFRVVALLASLLRYAPPYPYAEPFVRLVLENVLIGGADIGTADASAGLCASGTRLAK